jgi:LacI family transcriptional regulator
MAQADRRRDELVARVTLLDIAEACGLSRSAVSLVLQDSPRVSEDTKVRVRQVMADMGYVYDRAAANLRTKRSMTVGLIVTNVRNPYFAELTMAIEQGLQDAGYTLLQGYSYDELDRQERLLSTMIEHRADGIIILPAADSDAASMRMLSAATGTPHVLIARQIKGYDADYAGVDNLKSGQLLGEHLRGLGARTVAFVGGPANSTARKDRYRGMQRVLKRAGITITQPAEHASRSTPMDGELVTHALLDAGGQPDVIVAYSDAVAVGVQHALRDRGLRAGVDVGVASFDDVADARYQSPPLTSVATFPTEIGAQAARLLLARIADPDRASESVIVAPELNPRESTTNLHPHTLRRVAASGASS